MKLPVKQRWHKEAKTFFRYIEKKYTIDEKHRSTFYGTTDNLDIFHEQIDTIKQEGATYRSKSGQIKKHPSWQIAKEAWSGFLMGLKALGLHEYQAKLGRPPGK